MSTSVNDAQAQGFLLLTLPNCSVSTPTTGSQTGILALQCITLTVPSQSVSDRDVWLVLKLNSFEMVVSPTQLINFSRSTHTYMFLPEDERMGPIQLTVPPDPSSPGSYEDLETMEVILSQYGVVHDMESYSVKGKNPDYNVEPTTESASQNQAIPFDLKGRLVLMDEYDGEVVATLDEAVPIKEDKSLAAFGREKDPVVINLPGDEEVLAGRREAYAYPANAEERDLLMKTAGLISRGIILATSAVASGMTSASNYYISHSTPSSKPVEFSPRVRANMRRVHKISGTAVAVTSKTTGTILRTIDSVAGRLAGPNTRPASGSRTPSQSQLAPPPLPPRSGSPIRDSRFPVDSGALHTAYGTPPTKHYGTPSTTASSTPPTAYGTPPAAYGTSLTAYGTPPAVYGTPQTGQGTPSTGYGTPPVGAGTPSAGMPPPPPQRKRGLLNRLLASTDLILTTVEHSAKELIETGTDAVSNSLAHKYGQHAGDASRVAGESMRNVGLVYIDVKGVGRRALLKRAGKAVVKARMGGRDVVLGPHVQPGQPFGDSPGVQPGVQPIAPPPDYSQAMSAKGGSVIPGGFKS